VITRNLAYGLIVHFAPDIASIKISLSAEANNNNRTNLQDCYCKNSLCLFPIYVINIEDYNCRCNLAPPPPSLPLSPPRVFLAIDASSLSRIYSIEIQPRRRKTATVRIPARGECHFRYADLSPVVIIPSRPLESSFLRLSHSFMRFHLCHLNSTRHRAHLSRLLSHSTSRARPFACDLSSVLYSSLLIFHRVPFGSSIVPLSVKT